MFRVLGNKKEKQARTCLQKNTDSSDDYSLHGKCGKQPENWKRDTPEECQSLCKSVSDCKYFTWVPPSSSWAVGRKRCCLKNKDNIGFPDPKKQGLVSGSRECSKRLNYFIFKI